MSQNVKYNLKKKNIYFAAGGFDFRDNEKPIKDDTYSAVGIHKMIV